MLNRHIKGRKVGSIIRLLDLPTSQYKVFVSGFGAWFNHTLQSSFQQFRHDRRENVCNVLRIPLNKQRDWRGFLALNTLEFSSKVSGLPSQILKYCSTFKNVFMIVRRLSFSFCVFAFFSLNDVDV